LIDGQPATGNHDTHSSDDADAVLLFESQDYLKLRFLLDLLDQEGIPYATRKLTQHGGAAASEILTVGLSTASAVGGEGRIYVNAEDYEKAKELLVALDGTELIGDEDIDVENEK
jgi:hypothetical protein